MLRVIEQLAGETKRGIYLYSAFDELPAFTSYHQLFERTAAYMERFRAAGVEGHTRVLLPFDTSVEVIASFLALIGAGAIAFSVKPLDERSGPEGRMYLETLCQRFRITHHIRPASARSADLPIHEIVLPREPSARAAFTPASGSDLAIVQFSSGSTSSPKGIPITRDALERHLGLLVASDERTSDDVYVSWLPLYHDLGLILGMLTSLYARNDLHLISPFQFVRDPLGWLWLLSERRATHTVTPYFAINHCLNRLERDHDERSSRFNFEPLRSFLIGSDPIDFDRTLEFQRRLEPFGFRRRTLVPAYGMAEAVLVVSATGLADEPWAHTLPDGRKLSSTGRLLPGFEARITREDGSACDEGELGQVELRGGTMARGYFEDPTPFYNAAGYFETGDLAYSVRGELIIAGRAGDRIKVNGQTLFASDFEFATQSLPFVKPGQAVVFQLDDQIIVLAQPSNQVGFPLHECKQIVSDTIAKRLGVKLPLANIHFIAPGQIKKTTSGKLKRRSMAQSFLDGTIRFVTSEAAAVPAASTTAISV